MTVKRLREIIQADLSEYSDTELEQLIEKMNHMASILVSEYIHKNGNKQSHKL